MALADYQGAILPATSCWRQRGAIIKGFGVPKDDFFLIARMAGCNVSKKKGEWSENVVPYGAE